MAVELLPPSLWIPQHLNFYYSYWPLNTNVNSSAGPTHDDSVRRCQDFNELCPSQHNSKCTGALWSHCVHKRAQGRGYTHAHKQCALGLLIVYFLHSLLQGRAENELAWHIRIQTFLFCRTPDTEEVTVPLISPVKPLTTPIGHICLCHKIKNDFQTQPPLWSGFLRPNWLVTEGAGRS